MRDAESSGGTFFDGMSHEQMLAWLDQANSGVVSAAAARLKSAADEIEKIAGELKVRPQRVSWKGDGADAFRTWAADLAAATLRLSDFSRDSGTWLGHASDSIALAQSSVPRDLPGATANLAAARAAHNDPDSAAVASKSSAELAALAADREKVRLEAAAQMTKLAQSYSWSATQLNGLERPKLPPPPSAFVPQDIGSRDDTSHHITVNNSRSEGSGSVPAGSGGSLNSPHSPATSVAVTSLPHGAATPSVPGEVQPATRTTIDSVGTLPHQTPVDNPRSPVDPGPGRGTTPQPGPVPPLSGGGHGLPVNNPAVQGRTLGVGRASMPLPGQNTGTATPLGRVPNVAGGNGIVGGRPVLPSEGRATGAIPRGTVVGGEGTPVRGPMGQTASMANSVGRVTGAPGVTSGSRPVSAPGGITGGRPRPNPSVVGGSRAQQPGRTGGRVSGSGTVGGSGEGTRNAVTGGTTGAARSGEGHGATSSASRPSQRTPPTSTRNGSGRPYGVTEDEETWQRNQRPTVPPVID